ncbi:MAG: phosphoribosylglycinamide formyltransferase [Deltaproteobacteria bacterium]|nr:MAG: phosphoribosylglycinamide formyltransferase [Deltaproteobacteria bacterium]TMA70351.1 MAG: phosphoribosylglycinamide formyltransferase [Deltaproteobacteria bacterium]TMB45101.1 MAG: phosphoribosylglycinamide formyltransferase [Deltaproteobacteria bacterium]
MVVAAGVLISGAGTNLQAILDRIAVGRLACTLRVVISNRPGVPGLGRAERAGVPTRVIDHRRFAGREEFERAILTALREAEVELVLLAGFDRLITRTLIEAFPLRIMNIHPALLPAFRGLQAQAAARAYGVKIAGATVHFVDEQADHGPIILQGAIPIGPDDTEAEVRDRILAVEHEIYPTAIQFFAEGRLEVEDRRVRVRGVPPPLPRPLISW